MIELRELEDIRAFDEAMQAIAHASSPSATPAATPTTTTTTTNIDNGNIASDNASAYATVSNEENNNKDNDDDEDEDEDNGGFFIGDTEDGEISDFNTSYIIEEQKIPLNDVLVADDGDADHHHHVFSPLKRMHSLPADPNSISGCSTTSHHTSFLPSCASISEGDEQQVARRNSVEHDHTADANDATHTIATAANDKTKQSSFPTKFNKKSASLLSLNSLGGRSNDGDDEKADTSVSSSRRGRFIKSCIHGLPQGRSQEQEWGGRIGL